jgi:hypothetical protein
MAKKLDTLKYDFDRMKEDTSYKMNELNKAMNHKADRDDMLEGDRILHERIDNLEKALAKAKSDLKKAIRVLDERVKKLMTGGVSDMGGRGMEQDAMFSRKPLEGISCASCEKNLTNMSGMPAQYYNWKRLPVSHDRVPMIGQGFSRILQTLGQQNIEAQQQAHKRNSSIHAEEE